VRDYCFRFAAVVCFVLELSASGAADKLKRTATDYVVEGIALRDRGRTAESLASFERALELAPKFLPALAGAADERQRTAEADRAELDDRVDAGVLQFAQLRLGLRDLHLGVPAVEARVRDLDFGGQVEDVLVHEHGAELVGGNRAVQGVDLVHMSDLIGLSCASGGNSISEREPDTDGGEPMEPLSPQDMSFLEIEDDVNHMHIGSVGIFEGPPPSPDELFSGIGAKLHLVPRYRQRVRYPPLHLGPAVWIDDPHFSLPYHVRRTALASPGGDGVHRGPCALERQPKGFEAKWQRSWAERQRFAVDWCLGDDLAPVRNGRVPAACRGGGKCLHRDAGDVAQGRAGEVEDHAVGVPKHVYSIVVLTQHCGSMLDIIQCAF